MKDLDPFQPVLVLEGIEAVGGGGDHRRGADALQERLPLLDQHLKEAHLPHPAHLVAAAGLLRAQDAEVHPGRLEDPRRRLRHRLGAHIVGRDAPHEPEHLAPLPRALDPESLRPGRPILPGEPQGVALAEDPHQRVADGAGDLAALHQLAPQGHNQLRRSHVLGAPLHAGETGGAIPQLLQVPRIGERVHQRLVDQEADVEGGCDGDGTAASAFAALDAAQQVKTEAEFLCQFLDVHLHRILPYP